MDRSFGVIDLDIDEGAKPPEGNALPLRSEEYPHPVNGRRLVGVPARTRRSKKHKSKTDYVAYPDEAIEALLKIGATSQSHLSSLSSQRLAMTTFNLGLVTASITYLLGKDPAQNAGVITQQSGYPSRVISGRVL
ncbi:hypothetical protein [Roseibium sp. M-1]